MRTVTTIERILRRPALRATVARLALAVLALALAVWLRFSFLDALPPGIYRDEAQNGLDALRVLDGERPIFFEANNGREPLFIYLQALSVGLFGRSPGALRLVSALVGTLALPALYWLGRELFDRRIATLAAAIAATSVWMLNLSRVAFRAVTMAPMLAISLAALWRGLRRRQLGWMALAGAALGLSQYTYLAARFSVAAVLFFMFYIWRCRQGLLQRESFWLKGWALFWGAAAIVAAPLVVYLASMALASDSTSVLGRSAQVSILNSTVNGGDLWGTLVRQIWRTGLGLFIRGDFIPRHNVPLRPILHPAIALTFLVGVAVAGRRARTQPACALCLIWLVIMLLPTILAEGAPHMLRGSGVLPALYLLPALGLATLIERAREHVPKGFAWAGLAVALAVSGGSEALAYSRHLRSEAVYFNYESAATELAVEANRWRGIGWQGEGLSAPEAELQVERQVLLARRLWRDWPSVQFLCPPSQSLQVLPKDEQIQGAPLAGDALLLLWPFESNANALALLPVNRLVSASTGPLERGDLETESRPLYYRVATSSPDAVARNIQATWQEGISLVGYQIERLIGQDALEITLYWQAEAGLATDFTVFCHVWQGETRIGQHDGPPAEGYYGTSLWRPGDTVQDRHLAELTQPLGDQAEVQVGLYNSRTMQRLSLAALDGAPASEDHVALPIRSK